MPDIFESGKHKSSSKSEKAESKKDSRHRHVDEYSKILRQEEPTQNPLKSFAAKPVNIEFDALQSEENVLLVLRQHPLTQVKWVLGAVFLVLVPYLFRYVGLLDFLPAKYHFIAMIGWYMIIVGYTFEAFLNWFYNVYIITDERVIDVDFSLLFKNTSFAKIDKIEDISATTSGTLGAIFDYGTIKIQTAAAVTEFEFEHVPHPTKVAALLNELIVEEEKEKLEGRAN